MYGKKTDVGQREKTLRLVGGQSSRELSHRMLSKLSFETRTKCFCHWACRWFPWGVNIDHRDTLCISLFHSMIDKRAIQ